MRLLVYQRVNRRDVFRRIRRHNLIQRRYGMPCSHISGILFVIIEIAIGQFPVFIADQTICLDLGWIELDLDLHIFGDGEQGSRHLRNQHFFCFQRIVDIGIVAVSFVGQRFHLIILDVSHTKAKHGEIDPLIAPLLNQPGQFAFAGRSDIKITVSCQNDPIVAVFNEFFFGDLVGQLDSFAAGGGAACLQSVDFGVDDRFFIAGSRVQHQSGCPGINHNRHSVLGPQLLHQQLECLFQQRQLVFGKHRP